MLSHEPAHFTSDVAVCSSHQRTSEPPESMKRVIGIPTRIQKLARNQSAVLRAESAERFDNCFLTIPIVDELHPRVEQYSFYLSHGFINSNCELENLRLQCKPKVPSGQFMMRHHWFDIAFHVR